MVGGLICLGLVSSISAMTWIGPRVTMTMGEDIPMLRLFARTSKSGVPVAAILFQLAVVNLMLLSNSFEAVLDFIQFSLTACSFLAVLGVIWLRLTKPKLPRPYRAWGYPVTPLVFLAVTGFMMYYLVTNRPLQSLAGFAMMLAGLAIYGVSQLMNRRPPRPSRPSIAPSNPSMTRILKAAFVTACLWPSWPSRRCRRRASISTRSAGDRRRRARPSPRRPARAPAAAAGAGGDHRRDHAPAATSTTRCASSPACRRPPARRSRRSPTTRAGGSTRASSIARSASSTAASSPRRAPGRRRICGVHRPTMFYMFSGPDFLYADAFFPEATTYVLAALEPVGQIPDLQKIPRGSLGPSLGTVSSSMHTVLSFSFFITHNMRSQLSSGRLNGTIPILYVFLARSGKTVKEVSLINLDADGNERPESAGRKERGARREDPVCGRRRPASGRSITSAPISPTTACRPAAS